MGKVTMWVQVTMRLVFASTCLPRPAGIRDHRQAGSPREASLKLLTRGQSWHPPSGWGQTAQEKCGISGPLWWRMTAQPQSDPMSSKGVIQYQVKELVFNDCYFTHYLDMLWPTLQLLHCTVGHSLTAIWPSAVLMTSWRAIETKYD